MELDVTAIVNGDTPGPCAGSVAQYGENAARDTFNNACQAGEQIIGNGVRWDAKVKNALKNYLKATGFGTSEELDAYSDQELKGLLFQLVHLEIWESGSGLSEKDEYGEYSSESGMLYSSEGATKWYIDLSA